MPDHAPDVPVPDPAPEQAPRWEITAHNAETSAAMRPLIADLVKVQDERDYLRWLLAESEWRELKALRTLESTSLRLHAELDQARHGWTHWRGQAERYRAERDRARVDLVGVEDACEDLRAEHDALRSALRYTLAALNNWLDGETTTPNAEDIETAHRAGRVLTDSYVSAAPSSVQRDTPRPALCDSCGQWHDSTGRQLIGWEAADGSGKQYALPPGHMPPDYHIDAATGWKPIYGVCRAAPPSAGPVETEPACDCHLYEEQVCDICQGWTGDEKDVASAAPSEATPPGDLALKFERARLAVLHGIEGTNYRDVGGVSKDEALEYAAEFIRAYERAPSSPAVPSEAVIERAARAAREVFAAWRNTDDPATEPWRAVARAVLGAAREGGTT